MAAGTVGARVELPDSATIAVKMMRLSKPWIELLELDVISVIKIYSIRSRRRIALTTHSSGVTVSGRIGILHSQPAATMGNVIIFQYAVPGTNISSLCSADSALL